MLHQIDIPAQEQQTDGVICCQYMQQRPQTVAAGSHSTILHGRLVSCDPLLTRISHNSTRTASKVATWQPAHPADHPAVSKFEALKLAIRNSVEVIASRRL